MGTCLSKKSTSASSPSSRSAIPSNPKPETKSINPQTKKPEEGVVKKEIFIIKHRKSHEIERIEDEKGESMKINSIEVLEPVKVSAISNGSKSNGGLGKEDGIGIVVSAPVRTSSCTKEEVDAILIQCGRLSRSSSTGKAAFSGSVGSSDNNNPGTSNLQRTKKYSGSKRSYDFDNENGGEKSEENVVDVEDQTERLHRHRNRQRQPSASPKSRRRTPSREREQLQRSGSRERNGSNGGGRRVSRSPGRRSESPITTSNGGANSGCGNGGRPGKMVSVPATVSSLAMDKSIDAANNGEHISSAAVKRIQVKRNVGGADNGSRTTASPRARSPARKVSTENQPISLSRSNSRKAEHSPYRRNPLSEIDTNVVIEPGTTKAAKNTNLSQNKLSSNKAKEEQQLLVEETKVNVVIAGTESVKPQTVTRTRSSRLSRDLDINPEALMNSSNSTQNYTALLLEDIQNFHQKSIIPNTITPAFSLPACVTKACSILEAVADLNSSTSSNLTNAFSDERRRNLNFASEQFVKNDNKRLGVNKDPFLESEVAVGDDLMEPSIHKYVTLRRGNVDGAVADDQESSGSNSYVGGQTHWLSHSSWEPNSSDSTSRSFSHEMDEGKRRLAAKKRETENQQTGIGHGRIGSRGLHVSSTAPATATKS